MSENWKIQVSPKTPSGTLVNLRAETTVEMQQLLSDATELGILIAGFERAVGALNTLAPLSTGPSTATAPVQDSSSQVFPSTPPVAVQPQASPATGGPTCIHGARKYITGTKNGKAWAMWACPTLKDAPDKCSPQWA